MLIKAIGNDFNKTTRVMVFVGIVLLVLGVMALIIVMTNSSLESFIDGFYSGTGAGLVLVGLVLIVYNGIILKNPERRKKAEIKAQDERNKFIILKASSLTLFITGGLLYAAVLIAGTLNMTVFFTLMAVLGVEMLALFIISAMLRFFY